MNKSISLILPHKSHLIVSGTPKEVTVLRMVKLMNKKQFKIQVLNNKDVVLEEFLTDLSIRLKTGEGFVILELLNQGKIIVEIQGKKFLKEEELKKYVTTLII